MLFQNGQSMFTTYKRLIFQKLVDKSVWRSEILHDTGFMQEDSLIKLPKDILLTIVGYLDLSDIAICLRSARR